MYIKKVGVVGAGTMGSDIAFVVASAGIPVVIKDVSGSVLDNSRKHIEQLFQGRVKKGRMTEEDAQGHLARMTWTASDDGLADVSLGIEAVPEQRAIKEAVFRELDQILPPLSMIVTNTSALSVHMLSKVTSRPSRIAGLHFFYPAHQMKLVEIIRGPETSQETVETLMRFSEEIRKISVVVQDRPGFVVNRVLMAAMAEVLRFREETGIRPEEIDQVITSRGLAPMGPFVLADALGLDVVWEVSKTLVEAYGDRFEVGGEVERLVRDRCFGQKSGQGFYSYQ